MSQKGRAFRMSRLTREPISVTWEIDPAEMSRRGRIGSAVVHSRYDGRDLTAAARAAFLARFEHDVDPDGTLAPEERRRRAEHARRAHMLRLARLSAIARKAPRAESTEPAEPADARERAHAPPTPSAPSRSVEQCA